jgi:hypothetical protein
MSLVGQKHRLLQRSNGRFTSVSGHRIEGYYLVRGYLGYSPHIPAEPDKGAIVEMAGNDGPSGP